MKTIYRLLVTLLIVGVLAVPAASSAQTVCEGFSTVLNALKSAGTRKKLKFYTLPGATCKFDDAAGASYICDWPMPGPGNRAGRAERRAWYGSVSNEIKTLAGAFQQCIDEKQVPYKWASFDQEEDVHSKLPKYYIYTKRSPRRSVVVCLIEFDHQLPADQWRTGAKLRVAVHKGRENVCRLQ